MKTDGANKSNALIRQEFMSLPWTPELLAEHVRNRNGDVSTFNNGIIAFEKFLRSTRDPLGHALYLSMMVGRAEAERVVEQYSKAILKERLDNPPLSGLSTGGFIARAPHGDIAVVPKNAIHREEVSNAALVAMDERSFPEDGIPRFLWPSSLHLNREILPKLWAREADGLMALAGSMYVRFDEKTVSFDVKDSANPLGTFSPVDYFAERVHSIQDTDTFLKAWNAHLEGLLDAVLETRAKMEGMLAEEARISHKGAYEDPVISNPKAFAVAVRKVIGFAKAAQLAFMYNQTFKGTWEYVFIRSQVAKINNSMIPPYSIAGAHDDMLYSKVSNVIKVLMDPMDPISLLDKVYVLEPSISEWIRIEFEGETPESFEGKRSPELRMLIDEIVYQAGAAEGDKKRISFAIGKNTVTALDKNGGKAFSPFVESAEKRKVLEDLVARMGPGAEIDFHEEELDGKTRILRAIDITVPMEDGSTSGGGIRSTGQGGHPSNSTGNSQSGYGAISPLASGAQAMVGGLLFARAGASAHAVI